MLVGNTNIYCRYHTPTKTVRVNMEDIRKLIERKRKEDILFIERQLELFEALTEKRIELIRAVLESNPKSIRELASIVDRDVKNVFEDLKLLNRMRIITLERMGRCVVPKVRKKIIIINLM
jgi:predicted transcriptional regulator